MVAEQIASRGVRSVSVLRALEKVPRERFVPAGRRDQAFEDHPLPIGYGQTISQPYVVAFISQALDVAPGQRVLEVGTGCGYQTAVLAMLGASVWSVERVPPLAARAREVLDELGVAGVTLRVGDGCLGWPEQAPFDRILVAAASPSVPAALVDQLADQGRLILPVGEDVQHLVLLRRDGDRVSREALLAVRFVPLVPGVAPVASDDD